jgi:hypothetical protein
MDKFDQMMQTMSLMTEEERKKKIEDFSSLCICPSCPTYNKCAQEKSELLYCLLGASPRCITEEVGCICPACPVWEKTDFENEYYCTKGTEKELRET